MAAETGIAQYGGWNLNSVGGGTVLSPGRITGGTLTPKSAATEYPGVGGFASIRPGLVANTPSLKVQATADTKTLWGNSIPTSGLLPLLRATVGSTQQIFSYTTGSVNRATWSAKSDGAPMECDFEFVFLKGATTTAVAQPAETTDLIMSYLMVLTVGGVDYGCYSAEGSVVNGVKALNTFSTKASGVKRQPTALVRALDRHELTVETYNPIIVDPTVDSPASVGLVAAFVMPTGTWTFTYSSLVWGDPSSEQDFNAEGEVGYRTKLMGVPGCLVIS